MSHDYNEYTDGWWRYVSYVLVEDQQTSRTIKYTNNIETRFCLFCCSFIINFRWIHIIHLPILFKVASLLLGQSYDCPSAIEAALKNIKNNNKTQQKQIASIWLRHQVEPFSALLALCAGNSSVTKTSDAGLWCFLWSAPEQTVQ